MAHEDERVKGMLSKKWPGAQAFLDAAILAGYNVTATADSGLTIRKIPDDGSVATVMLSLGGPDDVDPDAYYLTITTFAGETQHIRLAVPHGDHILKFLEGGYGT